ncbi:MAG: AAA family ATPase [Exilibacterium sp.]
MPSTDSTINPADCLPVGISDFGKLIQGHHTFVDKSLLIRDIIRSGAEVTFINRPRRFGKTLNLSMLHHFFAGRIAEQPTRHLFDGLAIAGDPASMAHQGQYPVVFFTFKGIKERNFDAAVDKLRASVAELYLNYPELIDSPRLAEEQRAKVATIRAEKANLTDLGNAFKTLSDYLYLHYQKPVLLLIDEYDTPIQSAYLHGFYQDMVDLMRNLLGEGLKDNSSLYKAVVTGILRVSRESLFSGLNNLELYTVLDDRYSQYFGFTEEETERLLGDFDARNLTADIQSWYNGYQFGSRVIYNPWSIINCLKQGGQMRPYWLNTSDNGLLKRLMARADAGFKQKLEQLIQERSVEELVDPNIVFGDLNKSTTALWSLLLFSGYLTASDPRYDRRGTVTCRLYVPNEEVLGLYERHIGEWFSDTMDSAGYGAFLNCLVTGNLEEFEMRLAEYLRESASYFDVGHHHPEKFYHGLVLGLIAGLKDTHVIYSNRESGYGRYDVAVLPRETAPDDQRLGLLLEFKAVKDSESLQDAARAARRQIDERRYQTELELHKTGRIVKIGLAFEGKRVVMAHTDE